VDYSLNPVLLKHVDKRSNVIDVTLDEVESSNQIPHK
jgi:hypothetical protein